jgi:hypothetical protein
MENRFRKSEIHKFRPEIGEICEYPEISENFQERGIIRRVEKKCLVFI